MGPARIMELGYITPRCRNDPLSSSCPVSSRASQQAHMALSLPNSPYPRTTFQTAISKRGRVCSMRMNLPYEGSGMVGCMKAWSHSAPSFDLDANAPLVFGRHAPHSRPLLHPADPCAISSINRNATVRARVAMAFRDSASSCPRGQCASRTRCASAIAPCA